MNDVSLSAILPLSIEQASLAESRFRVRNWKFPLAFELAGARDSDALDLALRRVLARHEALRLRLRAGPDGRVVQYIADPPDQPVMERAILGERSQLLAEVQRRFTEPMDLEGAADDPGAGPLRATLFELSPTRAVFTATVHHLAWDARSLPVFADDLAAAYTAAVAGLPAPRQPAGAWSAHVRRQHAAGGQLPETELAWWQRYLAGSQAPPPHAGPPRYPRGAENWSFAWQAEPFPPGTDQALARLARAHRLTVPAIVHTLLAQALLRWTRQDSARYYYLHHGRDRRELAQAVGLFARSVPIVHRRMTGEPFAESCRRVMHETLEAVRRSRPPFSASRLNGALRELESAADGEAVTRTNTRVTLNLEVGDARGNGDGVAGGGLEVRRVTRTAPAAGELLRAPVPWPRRLWIWAYVAEPTTLRAEFDGRVFPPETVQALLTDVREHAAALI